MTSAKRELFITIALFVLTITATILMIADMAQQLSSAWPRSTRAAVEIIAFYAIAMSLLYGNLIYQVTRLGYWQRRLTQQPAPLAALHGIYDRPSAPQVCILIPSYKEELRVLRQTVISAAVVEYPSRRVAVLIDDPPSGTPAERRSIEAARQLILQLNWTFWSAARRLRNEHRQYLAREQTGVVDDRSEAENLARLYRDLARWLERLPEGAERDASAAFAHVDRLFLEKIISAPAAAHRARAAALLETVPDPAVIAREYRRIATLLAVEVSCFERKRYENLSHQLNKAMNLNAYIGLIGRSFRTAEIDGRTHLVECAEHEAELVVPAADYLLTLDADSLLLSDYALRLVDILEKDRGLAVAQTPYSAIPGAPTTLERVAGATTDIQYFVHQGFTRFNATYWVGANAVIRRTALDELRSEVKERGHVVPVFIQDRTVIEDTGSTIDLVRLGWRLHNHPERLAYSATPPDFGALIVQRRRWANGGLIILADLLRLVLARSGPRIDFVELWIRCHYLASPALANLGLLLLLFVPFDSALASLWVPLTAVPYYYLYGRDLRRAGYCWSDLLRVYALNLLLMPVNLAGVYRSLQQALTGKKAAFGRTPKVEGRTGMQPLHVVLQWGLFAYVLVALGVDLAAGRTFHALFSFGNAAFLGYGLTRLVGWRAGWEDLCAAASARGGIAKRWSSATDGAALARLSQAPPADGEPVDDSLSAAIVRQAG